MRFVNQRSTVLAACSVMVLLSAPSRADDTEIFFGNPANVSAPNILLVLDTSGSMGSNVTTTVPYDPAISYSGSGTCAGISDRVYFTTGSNPPSCGSDNWLPVSQVKCAAALTNRALGSGGTGIYLDRFVRWGGRNNKNWQARLEPRNAADLECREDNGVDGDLSATNPYPVANTSTNTTGVWTGDASSSYWTAGSGVAGTLFSANYVTYWNQYRSPSVRTRMEIMKEAATNLVNSLNGVNVGLMRYSRNNLSGDSAARGGMVVYPVTPIASGRADLVAQIDAFTANGFTPLSETLYEAYRYYSGGEVLFGNDSVPVESVAASRDPATPDGANYNSPADYSCQKNYVVFLTDGLPTADREANSLITAPSDFATLGGACDVTGSNPDWPDAGLCLVALSRYMFSKDLRSDIDGAQNVISHWIGFGDDVAGGAPFTYLERAAAAGGGQAYAAQDSAGLTSVLTSIVTGILQASTTFTAPTVAVNAFNRTRSLSDLYVSVFQPADTRHWPGNLKKYRVKTTADGAVVVGQNAAIPAIDESTGFFVDAAQSFWSASADGPRVRDGGAANELPSPTTRDVYTFIGANPASPALLTTADHALNTSNAALTDVVLSLGAPGDPTRDDLINWVRGADLLDDYPWSTPPGPNGDRAEQRRSMGDPIHAQPALVIYGGTPATPNIDDAVAFLPTNDGYLHAFDASTGEELWSFIPQEVLGDMKDLYLDTPSAGKAYLLDGEIRVLKFDINGDGVVDAAAGDRVIIYVGQGRGGSNYYALDVTDKQGPRFMWSLGAAELPGVGQAWSTPVVARVNISGAAQNSQKLVLVMGGGYDPIEDNVAYVDADSVGNRIYMVDALTGTLLWSAGSSGATFNHARMTHSIPASVSVVDVDSDGYADRMYVGDMAAQLWRFDITNGAVASSLVAGGVIASLGSHDEATHTAANNRRFYNLPDVAAIQRPNGGPFLNIAIGSGYRGRPLNTSARDRFYSIRDLRGFTPLSQDDYDNLVITTDGDIMDVTTDMTPNIPVGSPGWKVNLNQPGGSWQGEKALGQATTIDNKIIFTTYAPPTSAPVDPCAAGRGTNRAYAVNVLNGSPVRVDGSVGPEDRYEQFTFGGIASDISTMVLDHQPEPCTGPTCPEDEAETRFVCLAGVRVLNICRDFNSRVKTYWRESGAY